MLAPGESFEYSSWCPLKTSTGVMRGTYQMVSEGGDQFDIEIAPFALQGPLHRSLRVDVRLKPDVTAAFVQQSRHDSGFST